MAISFHCESCKNKITAPDNAGGKWGKCPYCNHRCYIPMPETGEEEELKLAPVDERDENEYKKMMRETYHVAEALLQEKEIPPEPSQGAKIDEKQLTIRIIKYLSQMAQGQFDDAQSTADKIVIYKTQAKAILEKMLKTPRAEPELANVPAKVLEGFIKNMLTRIG